jgi:hypothetical protein
MIKLDNVNTYNFQGALRGMRNPLKSWSASDSNFDDYGNIISFGQKDRELALKLVQAGSDHRKFLRQIFFSADITAPDYFWKEMDTYKVSTVANSTSTMHTITSRALTVDDFSWDMVEEFQTNHLDYLNLLILDYQQNKTNVLTIHSIFRKIIQNLPMSFNYTRTWTANYEVLRNIYKARKNHKLSEWHIFCSCISKIPLNELITN